MKKARPDEGRLCGVEGGGEGGGGEGAVEWRKVMPVDVVVRARLAVIAIAD
jgi:hypothetical protein